MSLQGPVRAQTRETLEAFAERYLGALVSNDPSRLPTTEHVVYSENDQLLALGEGAWATVTGVGTYRHVLADSEAGKVGLLGTVRENGVPAILDVCLTLDGERIARVESLFIRDALGARRLEAMGAPEDVWLTLVPEEERVSREMLVAAAHRYLAGMERNDGKGDYSFFHPECNRIEHGLQTTNVETPTAYGHSDDVEFSSLTAEEQWKTGFLGFVTEIRSRRVLVVDEERQAVLLAATLDHDGTIRSIELTTGKTFKIPPYFEVPRTLQVMEAFRVREGRLYRIEMTLTEVPFGTRPPLDPASPRPLPRASRVRGGAPASAAKVLARVLHAMRSHDVSELPLAAEVRYTENGQPLGVGEGLWRTLSSFAGADESSGACRVELHGDDGEQAGWAGLIEEQTVPGMLALRVRVIGGHLTEIEAVLVREEIMNERYGAITPFQPRLLVPFERARFGLGHLEPPQRAAGASRGRGTELLTVVEAYFDAVERDDSATVAFAPDCRRRENGWTTTLDPTAPALDPDAPNYRPFSLSCAELIDSGYFSRLGKVRGRHHVVDEDLGLVLSIVAYDMAGRVQSFEVKAVGQVRYPGLSMAETSEPSEDVLFGTRLDPNMIVPVTELTAQLTTIRDGRITSIEAFTRGGPYGMTTGFPV